MGILDGNSWYMLAGRDAGEILRWAEKETERCYSPPEPIVIKQSHFIQTFMVQY